MGLIRQVEGKYSQSLHFRELLKLLLDSDSEKEMILQNVGFVCQQIYTEVLCAKLHFIFVFCEEIEDSE